MKVLSREQLLLLHSQLINRYGGTHGVRDEGLLDSALNAPFQGFGDYEFYPTVTDKAVRLGYGLIENHPFHDGNKRIGALAMLTRKQESGTDELSITVYFSVSVLGLPAAST